MQKKMFAALFIIAVLFMSACAPIQEPAATQAPAQGEEAPQPEPMAIKNKGEVPRITLEEAKAHFDNGTATFVDSRGATDYEQAHIAGAIHRHELSMSDLVDTLPKDQLIITYCT